MPIIDIEDPVEVHTVHSVWRIEPIFKDGVRYYRATKTGVQEGYSDYLDIPVGYVEEGKNLFLEEGRSFELWTDGKRLISSIVKNFSYLEPHH